MSAVNYGSINGHPEVEQTGKMSIARHRFVFISIFDPLFTALVWIVCTVVIFNSSLACAFEHEVMSYTIKTSMFDVVVLSVLRAFVILLFYAIIRISHWSVIAFVTASSGMFIVAKVLIYKWAVVSNNTTLILLMLYSFVIPWFQSWFLDFRVFPSEATKPFIPSDTEPDTLPILRHELSRSQSDDGSAFYSPPGSDMDEENERVHDLNDPSRILFFSSGDEEEIIRAPEGSTVSEIQWLSPKNSSEGIAHPSPQEYRDLAKGALDSALNVIKSDGWVKEKCSGDDAIYSKYWQNYGKVYKFVGTIQMSPENLIDILYAKGEEMHKWNPTVKKFRVLQKIDDHIDVTHVIANESAAGIVSSRDFVNVRIWTKQNGSYIHALVGTTHAAEPASSKYIRGEHGPSIYVMTPSGSNGSKCELQWLLNTNLKGWLPQYLIDQTLSSVMLDYIQALRKQA